MSTVTLDYTSALLSNGLGLPADSIWGTATVNDAGGILAFDVTLNQTNFPTFFYGASPTISVSLDVSGAVFSNVLFSGSTGHAAANGAVCDNCPIFGPQLGQLASSHATFQIMNAGANLTVADVKGSVIQSWVLAVQDYCQVAVQDPITGAPITVGVPEPATWAMMLLGFGLVAGLAKFRKRKCCTV